MRTATLHTDAATANIYWNMLKDLSSEVKLELISKLSTSLLVKEQTTENIGWASQFAGHWADNRDVEEILDDIRSARTSNREIEL